MEDILKKIVGMGVSVESWILSFAVANLIALYRIFESDIQPTRRKMSAIVIMGLISCLLVPGLVVYWMEIDNAFIAALVTGLTVYSFEQVLQAARERFIKNIKKHKDDTNDNK